MSCKILQYDSWLTPYASALEGRMERYQEVRGRLLGDSSLMDFANGHRYFGIHPTQNGWVYREWAPAAEAMFFTGDFNGWDLYENPMTALQDGVWEITLPKDALSVGQKVQTIVCRNGETLRRIPAYATRVVQQEDHSWCCQIDTALTEEFPWTDGDFQPRKTPYIYECHIGMAQEAYKVGSYSEFTQNVLPRVKKMGYNTLQIMAVMEHPYYGSFGYQVSNFFAPSSRFGTAWELKELINTAHSMGIAVLLDVVHSHAVKNTEEGLSRFDGTEYQYFHGGERGNHPAWDTRLFDYGKPQVLHFLLSNLKYWMEVYHFDGFRFDGVTSMLYHDHALGTAFTDYSMYFTANTDDDALCYLQLANELVHTVNPHAITVAEDMSGMPGMALPIEDGGIGFDYRLSMGVPDLWIKLLKEVPDEHWSMGQLWYELTSRRAMEKNIGYCESHDQALVGDKTIMFRLCDAEMYRAMSKSIPSMTVDRGMALHKMIRLITAAFAGEGYLNFMGNEFGHPEWIDFPREGNGWSYHYCRRQWSLADRKDLRYGDLLSFDKAMLRTLKSGRLPGKTAALRLIHEDDKVLAAEKGSMLFCFNFHPNTSYEGYFIPTGTEGTYEVALSTDDGAFGGFDRVAHECYTAETFPDGRVGIRIYLPCRTAVVLRKVK